LTPFNHIRCVLPYLHCEACAYAVIQIKPIAWPWALDTRQLEAQKVTSDGSIDTRELALPHQKAAVLAHLLAQYDSVINILLSSRSTEFRMLLDDWSQTQASRSRFGSAWQTTYHFSRRHAQFIDRIDMFIIENVCAEELTLVFRARGLAHCNASEVILGPGASLLSYHALGFQLGISGEYACQLSFQDLLLRDQTLYEFAWAAISKRTLTTVLAAVKLEDTHRIPDPSIELSPVQIQEGPFFEVSDILWDKFLQLMRSVVTDTLC
jgi:hypothetical protein